MFVNVLDSKGIPLRNVEVKVYEWSSGVAEPVQSETTGDLGGAVFHLTFGRYKIWVYNEEHMIILNKTIASTQKFRMKHCYREICLYTYTSHFATRCAISVAATR